MRKKDLEKVFEGKLDNVETLCTDTHRSHKAFAKIKEVGHQKFNASKGQHIKNKVYHCSKCKQCLSKHFKEMDATI